MSRIYADLVESAHYLQIRFAREVGMEVEMKEHRSWEQVKSYNQGADWIVNGEFCKEYERTSTCDAVNEILENYMKSGLEGWQIPGFNGCWSCDHMIDCHMKKTTQHSLS